MVEIKKFDVCKHIHTLAVKVHKELVVKYLLIFWEIRNLIIWQILTHNLVTTIPLKYLIQFVIFVWYDIYLDIQIFLIYSNFPIKCITYHAKKITNLAMNPI